MDQADWIDNAGRIIFSFCWELNFDAEEHMICAPEHKDILSLNREEVINRRKSFESPINGRNSK